jgi:N-acetyl-anhydromuramyl-L-alanine amidase AmpD
LTKPWTNTSGGPTKEEIQFIRDFHTGTAPTDRNWADIAYHFLVDRAGRVWQGRPLVYQGAQVRNHNEHNIGVVLLGNFDIQPVDPTQAKSLVAFIGFLRKLYKISGTSVFTHQELADNKTDCPGSRLEQFMKDLRAKWV